MTHYRKAGNISHCGAEILPDGKDIPYIVIERIEFKESLSVNGRADSNKFIAYFAPNPYTNLPMILNRINQIRLMKLFPECGVHIDTLKNVAVRLTSEEAKNPSMEGMKLPSLRISKIPAKKPTAEVIPFPIDNQKIWDNAVEFLKKGGDIAQIKAKYIISEDIEQELKKQAQ